MFRNYLVAALRNLARILELGGCRAHGLSACRRHRSY